MQNRLLLVTSVAFVVALLLAGSVFYRGEVARVEAELIAKAHLVMDLADTTRVYTNDEVFPITGAGSTFHKPSVPSYASRRITEELLKRPEHAGYSIREAALAPINVDNRANAWEAGLIQRFTKEKPDGGYDLAALPSIVERKQVGETQVMALAEPIVMPAEPGCLRCHASREAAPPAMLAAYEGAAGFGWVPGDVVGVQVVTVPTEMAGEHARQRLISLLISLLAVFVLTFVVMQTMLSRLVLRPVRSTIDVALAASRGEPAPELPETPATELGELNAAVNRLRRSHDKALSLAHDQERRP